MLSDKFNKETIKPRQPIIYLLDTSGSMIGERIEQLNIAMSEAIRHTEEIAKKLDVYPCMRVIQFSSTARWIFGDAEHGVEHIDWEPLAADGSTNTAAAIELATNALCNELLVEGARRPVVIMITDGSSNDHLETLKAIDKLKSSLKSVFNTSNENFFRIFIGIGDAIDTIERDTFASQGFLVDNDGYIYSFSRGLHIEDLSLLKNVVINIIDNLFVDAMFLELERDFNLPLLPEGLEEFDGWEWEE